jgi:hypothetical protein
MDRLVLSEGDISNPLRSRKSIATYSWPKYLMPSFKQVYQHDMVFVQHGS